MRLLSPDPWPALERALPPGTSVAGVVTRLTNFGAFVKLDVGVDALIHITEVGEESPGESTPLEYLERYLEVGQRITARILAVNPDEHRLGLTLR
jgi:small subunit ribosomal protein S1